MGILSIWQWLIVLVIVLLLFGRDRIPKLAGDLAKGIKEFKSGMKDEEAPKSVEDTPPIIEGSNTTTTVDSSATKDQTVTR